MRYYAIIRPIMVGTIPKGSIGIKNFERPQFVEAIGRTAWGYVDYENEVDISDYDLIPADILEKQLKLKKLDNGNVLVNGAGFVNAEMSKPQALKEIRENNYSFRWEA